MWRSIIAHDVELSRRSLLLQCTKSQAWPQTCILLFTLYNHNNNHHHHRVVLTDRCAAPWPLKISVLHRDESGIALASSGTRLSQVRRGRPGGLVQLDDGFLPSWLFTIKSKALFAGTSGSRRATWPKRDRRRLRRISLIVGRPVFWSTSALVIWSHHEHLPLALHMKCSKRAYVGSQKCPGFSSVEQDRQQPLQYNDRMHAVSRRRTTNILLQKLHEVGLIITLPARAVTTIRSPQARSRNQLSAFVNKWVSFT